MAKTKQFGLVLCCVFSLLVSSVSACWCAEAAPETSKNHCAPEKVKDSAPTGHHSGAHHSHEDSSEARHEKSTSGVYSAQVPDECCCIQSAPKVFAKSEVVKIQKQSVLLAAFAPVEIKFVRQTKAVKISGFSMPFYLSDSFYNLSPGRAPPTL